MSKPTFTRHSYRRQAGAYREGYEAGLKVIRLVDILIGLAIGLGMWNAWFMLHP